MRTITFSSAIVEAQREEMERDKNVILIGEDVRGDLYGATTGLYNKFGERVINTPIAEAGLFGVGFGAAMVGMRPILDVGHCGFFYCAYDQIVSNAAKSRYMYGGQCTMPATLRANLTYGVGAPTAHCERNYPMFMNTPGIKIAVPSTPYDMKGILKEAIRDDNLCIVYETTLLRPTKGEVPEEDYTVPFGKAAIRREGKDVTIIALAAEVKKCLDAAEILAAEGIEAEVIDPVSLVPLDVETITASVRKTGRVVIDDPACLTCSAATEISTVIAENVFTSLKAPITRICAPDSPAPLGAQQNLFWANKEQIAETVRNVVCSEKKEA